MFVFSISDELVKWNNFKDKRSRFYIDLIVLGRPLPIHISIILLPILILQASPTDQVAIPKFFVHFLSPYRSLTCSECKGKYCSALSSVRLSCVPGGDGWRLYPGSGLHDDIAVTGRWRHNNFEPGTRVCPRVFTLLVCRPRLHTDVPTRVASWTRLDGQNCQIWLHQNIS